MISRKEQKRSHALRYVLKNRATDTVYLVVLFTLYLKEDVNEDGTIKEGVVGGKPHEMATKVGEGDDDDEAEVDEKEDATVAPPKEAMKSNDDDDDVD